MKTNKIVLWSVVNSLAVGVYSTAVAYIMINGNRFFGNVNNIVSALAFLMLFVLSAAVVGTLVLGRPLMLYLDGKKKEAAKMLGFTILFLFLLTLIVFIIFALVK